MGSGRPAKPPEDELVLDLKECIEDGNYIETACRKVGLSKSTFYDWLAKGRADAQGPFGAFASKMDKALAVAEAELVERIKDAADKDWKAAAWLLERTRPDKYARPQVRPTADAPSPPPPRQEADDEEQGAGSAFDELDAVTDIREAPSARKK